MFMIIVVYVREINAEISMHTLMPEVPCYET